MNEVEEFLTHHGAFDSAWGASWAASRSFSREASWDDARAEQAKWLRENCKPNFTMEIK